MSKFVLGSGSQVRLELLEKINFCPDIIEPANIDETPLKKEKPIDYVKRIAKSKAYALHSKYFGEVILCADTIASTESRIIQKPKDDEEIRKFLKHYSNRNVKTITSVFMITADNKEVQKTVETKIKFKTLNQRDIDEYVNGGYGRGKAGGLAIESLADSFIIKIVGSHSNILGLPLYEARNMLISAGVKSKEQ